MPTSAPEAPRRIRTPRTRAAIVAALVVGATATAGIAIAAAPAVTTKPATNLAATTATLNGTITPNENGTTYYFQYGTTTAYTTPTPTQTFNGNNANAKDVSADITGLAPSTLYHFRLVATNPSGTVFGTDMTFTTTAAGTPPPGPGANAVSITAKPTTVTFSRSTTITGKVTGPGSVGAMVMLEENPYPFTGGFKPTGTPSTTDAASNYSFVATPGMTTRYRVTVKKPNVTSPEVTIRVRVKVGFSVSDSTPSIGQRVRFAGTVLPAHNGKVARIQRRTSTGAWRTVASATLVAAAPVNGTPRSKFAKRLRVNNTGTYRVRVAPGDGDHIAGNSVRRTLRVH